MTQQRDPIGVNEMIAKIKEELLTVRDTAQPLFKIKQVELEIAFTVERNAEGSIDFKVVRGDVQKTWTEAQTIKLTLDPIVPLENVGQDLTVGEKAIAAKSLRRESSVE